MVKLREVLFIVRLFKVVTPNGDIDWVITNSPEETLTTRVAQEVSDVRWQVEELHRGLKQLTGTEKCQCRKARSQRNHIACCYHAWLFLKVHAGKAGQTRLVEGLLANGTPPTTNSGFFTFMSESPKKEFWLSRN